MRVCGILKPEAEAYTPSGKPILLGSSLDTSLHAKWTISGISRSAASKRAINQRQNRRN